jgi:hypothetical protein
MEGDMTKAIAVKYYMAGKEIKIPGREPSMIEPMLLQKDTKVTINKVMHWVNAIEYIYEFVNGAETTDAYCKLEVKVHLVNN